MQEKPMRRNDRQRSRAEAQAILRNGEYGILATVDAEGQPYGVPLSYIIKDGRLYFHCALEGHKIENIHQNPQVSFTVVGRTRPVYEKNFSTLYESAVIFGQVTRVEDEGEKYAVLHELAEKYLPEYMDRADGDIKHSLARTAVYSLSLDVMTAKAKH